MNLFMILVIVFGVLTVIGVICISVYQGSEPALFFIGCTAMSLLMTIICLSCESERENALNRYVIVRSVTYGDMANTFKYNTNYPAFEFLSDTLIYKPGDTVWLGVKK